MKKIVYLFCLSLILFLPLVSFAATSYISNPLGVNSCPCTDSGNPCNNLKWVLANCTDIAGGDDFWLDGAASFGGSSLTITNTLSGTALDPTIFKRWPQPSIQPIMNAGGSPTGHGFRVDGAEHISIEGVMITDAPTSNIFAYNSAHNLVVQDTQVTGGLYGIHVSDSNEPFFNLVGAGNNNSRGIYLENAPDATIQRSNLFSNSNDGVSLTESENYLIVNNYIYNNGKSGINVLNLSNDGEIYFNSFYDTGCGTTLGSGGWTTGTAVTNNSFYATTAGNSCGIYLQSGPTSGPPANTFDYNNYYGSGPGAVLAKMCTTPTCPPNSPTTYTTISAWRTALGDCTGTGTPAGNECAYYSTATSVTDDPEYVAPGSGNLGITSGSPLIDLGVVIAGINDDHKGSISANRNDVGADEFDESPSIPEFTIFTLILSLMAGMGVIILIKRLQNNQQNI